MKELKTYFLNTNSGQTTCYVYFSSFPVDADAIEFTHITLPIAQYRQNYNFLFRKDEYSTGSGSLSMYVEPRSGSRHGYVYHTSIGEEKFSETEVVDGTMKFNGDGSVYVNGVEVKQQNGNTWYFPQGSRFNLFTDEHNRPLSVGTFGKINFYYQGNVVMNLTPYEDNGTVVLVDTINNITYNYSGSGSLDAVEYAGTINVNGSSIADAEESNITLSVSSEYDWSASTSANYISFVSGNTFVSAITGTSATTSCKINVLANTGSTQRASTVDFINATGDTATFELTQKKPQTVSYVFCDYIEGQYGVGGSYLDLGIKPSLDMEIEMTIQNSIREQGSQSARIIGNGESGGIEFYSTLDEYCVLNFGDATGIGSDLSLILPQSLSNIEIKINSTAMTRTWNNVPRTKTYTATELTGDTTNLFLNGATTGYCNAMRYGEVIIRKNGVVVFDGKPCIYGSQVGLYDFENNRFIAGQGRSFLAVNKYGYVIMGEEIPESITIGDEEVERMYLGENLIYMVAPFIGFDFSSSAELDTESGSTAQIDIKSSEPWSLSIDSAATWLSASTMSGNAGVSAITLTAVGPISANVSTIITATTSSFTATCSVSRLYSNYITCTDDVKGRFIDLGTYVDSSSFVEVQGMWKGIDQGDTVVGYLHEYDSSNGWRFFNYDGNPCFDWGAHRIHPTFDAHTSGKTFNFKLDNYGIYDNDSQQYLETDTPVSFTNTGDTVNVDVGTIWIKNIKIYRNNALVFDGVGTNDGSHIGIYDRIGQTMHYNSALTMTILTPTPPTPSQAGWVTAIFRTTQPNESVRLLNNTNFNSMKIDGVALQSVQNSYTFANAGDHTVELEYSSTTWSSRTFKEGDKLIKCYFGEGITNFQGDALTEQSALTEVYFAQSITGTGRANLYFDRNVNKLFGANTVDDKFWGLNGSLWCVAAAAVGSAVTIPTAFTNVNQYAFASYSGITDITFNSGITSVKANAFDNVSNVSALRFEGTTPPTFNDEPNIGSNGTIYVPSGCSSTYASSNWGYLVDDYGWTISEPTTPVADSISVSANQVDNEVAFSVGFTSSTYNSIWESQISNTIYDDAINNGDDPDDIDWVIAQGWENTNEGNPREANSYTPCDGYVKVYFFLYDNVNDSVSTATTWNNTYNGNGDCGEPEPEPQECTEWHTCECCGGSGMRYDEESETEIPCDCCDGMGGMDVIIPCPEPEEPPIEPEPEPEPEGEGE